MKRISFLERIEATVKFISFEPLLGWQGVQGFETLLKQSCQWVILGEQTKPTVHPRREWVESIIKAADRAHAAVFIKEPLATYMKIQRQEFPEMKA